MKAAKLWQSAVAKATAVNELAVPPAEKAERKKADDFNHTFEVATYQLRLHGIRHPSHLPSHDETVRRGISRSESDNGVGPSRRRPMSQAYQHETEWIRRHSLTVAAKNSEWAHYFLSTAASDSAIVGLLSIKNDVTRDAEYYFNFIPKAVVNQSPTYKELLAVYNALTLWGKKQDLFRAKHLLLGVHHNDAAKLLRKAKLTNKVDPAVVMILKEINDICRSLAIEYRVAELDHEISVKQTAPYLLLRLDDPKCKQKMKQLISAQSVEKGQRYIIKERMFPPVYV